MNDDNNTEKYKILIQKYLSLDNVSVLVGAGGSYHLGLPIIRNVPEELITTLEGSIEKYFYKDSSPSLEDLLNCLQADRFLLEKKHQDISEIERVIFTIQEWILKNCDVNKSYVREEYKDDLALKVNKFHYHELLIKKLLQRPNNLKRANLFTTNYDMAFDYALDNLGIHYINGFMGVHNRCFHPEVYDYDLFYPGQTTSGKIHRAERVIKYYKLHGSLSWVYNTPNPTNTYGITEIQLNENHSHKLEEKPNFMIYPCATKKAFTLDLPYSELFRQFAQAIIQPQSVLFCIGYSFNDEHINDIIYQALSNPSFSIIIANYSLEPNTNIERLKELGDKRIIILEQGENSKFCKFVKDVMPDLYSKDDNLIVQETLQKLYSLSKDNVVGNNNDIKQ